MSDIAELKRLGITKSELLDHYVYCMEFLWKVTGWPTEPCRRPFSFWMSFVLCPAIVLRPASYLGCIFSIVLLMLSCFPYGLPQVLQPRQSQRITIVIDLAGVRFRDLVGESLAFLKTSVGMMSRHYPQRSFKVNLVMCLVCTATGRSTTL